MGQRRAERLRHRYGAEITWLPFHLHPEYPPDGLPRERLVARYGPGAQAAMAERFAADDLDYNPNPDVVPNTIDALRLTELARDQRRHDEIHDRLMDAYWRDGVDIGDRDELRRLLDDLPRDDVERVLAGDDYRDRVLASTEQAQSIGIAGIPAFLLDSRLLVLGAHPPETFDRAFAQLAEA
ncbi:MAG TPA: DsbA family protein [Gaiellaceae bacterium]|nr:DsbA family protein [Gaiellaceae bacterium]